MMNIVGKIKYCGPTNKSLNKDEKFCPRSLPRVLIFSWTDHLQNSLIMNTRALCAKFAGINCEILCRTFQIKSKQLRTRRLEIVNELCGKFFGWLGFHFAQQINSRELFCVPGANIFQTSWINEPIYCGALQIYVCLKLQFHRSIFEI